MGDLAVRQPPAEKVEAAIKFIPALGELEEGEDGEAAAEHPPQPQPAKRARAGKGAKRVKLEDTEVDTEEEEEEAEEEWEAAQLREGAAPAAAAAAGLQAKWGSKVEKCPIRCAAPAVRGQAHSWCNQRHAWPACRARSCCCKLPPAPEAAAQPPRSVVVLQDLVAGRQHLLRRRGDKLQAGVSAAPLRRAVQGCQQRQQLCAGAGPSPASLHCLPAAAQQPYACGAAVPRRALPAAQQHSASAVLRRALPAACTGSCMMRMGMQRSWTFWRQVPGCRVLLWCLQAAGSLLWCPRCLLGRLCPLHAGQAGRSAAACLLWPACRAGVLLAGVLSLCMSPPTCAASCGRAVLLFDQWWHLLAAFLLVLASPPALYAPPAPCSIASRCSCWRAAPGSSTIGACPWTTPPAWLLWPPAPCRRPRPRWRHLASRWSSHWACQSRTCCRWAASAARAVTAA